MILLSIAIESFFLNKQILETNNQYIEMVDFENALSKMTDVLTLLWFTVQKFNGQPVVGIPMDYWGLWTLRLN